MTYMWPNPTVEQISVSAKPSAEPLRARNTEQTAEHVLNNIKSRLNQVGQQVNEDQNERKHVNLKANMNEKAINIHTIVMEIARQKH